MKHITLLLVAALAAPAFADDAADHVSKATHAYDIQDWATALAEYKAAYTLDPRPETLWSIAQTQRLSGDCRGAILTYKAFMRGASATAANAAGDWIKKCESDLDAQQRAADAAAAAAAAKPAPAPAPIVVTAPPPKPAAPPPPPKPRTWYADPLGDVMFVAGVGALATGTTFLVLGDLHMGDASTKPNEGAYAKAVDDAQSQQTLGLALAAGGAVVTALAVWRFHAVASRPDEHVAVVPTRGGAFATLGWSF